MLKHSGTIQKRAVGTDDCAEQSCWKPWQQWSGRAHDPGSDGSGPMLQDRNSRAVRSEPSDTGLGCPTRCLAVQTVPSGEIGHNSTLCAECTRVLWRDWTLRGNCVLQIRWDTKEAAPAMRRWRIRPASVSSLNLR